MDKRTLRVETRGRPRIGDPGNISDIALEILIQNGWAATTMQQIAQAADVSTSTLFRYFPTKADVLWYRLGENVDFFYSACMEKVTRQSLADTLADSYLEMLLADSSRLSIVKKRLAIIEHDIDAANASWPKFEQWRLLVTKVVAKSSQQSKDSLSVRIVGAMSWSALWAAITAWARSDDLDPTSYVSTARHYMGLHMD